MLSIPSMVRNAVKERRRVLRHLAREAGHKLTELDALLAFGPIAPDLLALIADDLEQMQRQPIRRNQAARRSDKLTKLLKQLT